MNTFVINNEALKKGWGADGQYWFDLESCSIIEDFNIINYEVPDDADEERILTFKGVIPYFNIKRYELARAFVSTIDNAKIRAKFDNLEDDKVVEFFWKYFHVYPQYFSGMEEFQAKYLLDSAKAWCEENNINYTVEL